jgi:hypothetical protein
LRAGDDALIDAGSAVVAGRNLSLRGDYGNADAGVGARVDVLGSLRRRAVLVEGAGDADVLYLQPQALSVPTRVLGHGGEDALILDRLPTIDLGDKLSAGGTGRRRSSPARETAPRRDVVTLDGGAARRRLPGLRDGRQRLPVTVKDSGAEDDGADVLRIDGHSGQRPVPPAGVLRRAAAADRRARRGRPGRS